MTNINNIFGVTALIIGVFFVSTYNGLIEKIQTIRNSVNKSPAKYASRA